MSDSPSRSRARGPQLRLRHKLGVSLVIAALLPVLVASYVAFSVVLRGLNDGLDKETQRQLSVGLNLLLDRVETLGSEANRLALLAEVGRAVDLGPEASTRVIKRLRSTVVASLIQLADADGKLMARTAARSSPERFAGLAVAAGDPLISAGLRLERRVTIRKIGATLVVRAVAPLTDDRFRIAGLVLLSVPLDGVFADELKASLGTDVMIFSGTDGSTPARATFVDALGLRAAGVRIDPEAANSVAMGETTNGSATIAGGDFQLAYAPLKDATRAIVGVFAVAVDRAAVVSARRTAIKSLGFGGAGAFLFALGLAGLLSRRISRPLSRLHQGATAIARGDLNQVIEVDEGDEIGDLAAAFQNMTAALKENQRRLAARMREIVALHDAGRAVSSVIDLEKVLRKIVDSVARVLHVRVCAIWLVDDPGGGAKRMTLGAARAKRSDMRMISRGDEGAAMVEPLVVVARHVASERTALRVNNLDEDQEWRESAVSAGVTGSLIATPLERKGTVLGVIVIGRTDEARSFSEADSNLLATFADQAAAAVENASLYAEVRAFNEELEAKVKLRTTELTAINGELGRTITELRETQAQLILSERLAGLGQLVAGVAHEINSPSAAIRGTVEALPGTVKRLAVAGAELYRHGLTRPEDRVIARLVAALEASSGQTRVIAPAKKRRAARELAERLSRAGLAPDPAVSIGRTLAELPLAGADVDAAVELATSNSDRSEWIGEYLREQMYLHRGVSTIGEAITRIQRIVGGLKTYSHLDQDDARSESDIHEGLEGTLVLLAHAITRDISVKRKYGELPMVWVFVDELNQVWTNLIHNAVQAMEGSGKIEIETSLAPDGGSVEVSVTDDGPGIPDNLLSRIFEPFFTTKERGEGTGLGLGIARKIVEKHGGTMVCESNPGQTRFTVTLPVGSATTSVDREHDVAQG